MNSGGRHACIYLASFRTHAPLFVQRNMRTETKWVCFCAGLVLVLLAVQVVLTKVGGGPLRWVPVALSVVLSVVAVLLEASLHPRLVVFGGFPDVGGAAEVQREYAGVLSAPPITVQAQLATRAMNICDKTTLDILVVIANHFRGRFKKHVPNETLLGHLFIGSGIVINVADERSEAAVSNENALIVARSMCGLCWYSGGVARSRTAGLFVVLTRPEQAPLVAGLGGLLSEHRGTLQDVTRVVELAHQRASTGALVVFRKKIIRPLLCYVQWVCDQMRLDGHLLLEFQSDVEDQIHGWELNATQVLPVILECATEIERPRIKKITVWCRNQEALAHLTHGRIPTTCFKDDVEFAEETGKKTRILFVVRMGAGFKAPFVENLWKPSNLIHSDTTSQLVFACSQQCADRMVLQIRSEPAPAVGGPPPHKVETNAAAFNVGVNPPATHSIKPNEVLVFIHRDEKTSWQIVDATNVTTVRQLIQSLPKGFVQNQEGLQFVLRGKRHNLDVPIGDVKGKDIWLVWKTQAK